MARVGVTGAGGFIGGLLARTLVEHGHAVIGVDDFSGPVRSRSARVELVRSDLRDPGTFARFEGADAVLHLAASSGVVACANDPVGTALVNVGATEALARWTAAHGMPLAFASSFAVVGIPERLPITESTPARPTHEYARQKAAGEVAVGSAFAASGLPAAILRMSNVYGRYSALDGPVSKGNVLNLFAEQARTGALRVNAPGTQRRDYVHVLDVVAHWEAALAWLLAGRDRSVRTFNVASGESATVLDVAERVAGHWRRLHPDARPLRIDVVPNPRGSIELLQPEFEVSRAFTEATLGVRLTHSLDASLDAILLGEDLTAPASGRHDPP